MTDTMLEEAFETFNSGRERKWNPEQLLRTARHEAGHAFVCWKSGELPAYLTISARSGCGGYMQREQSEDKGTWSRREMLGQIRTALGGRAAEIVYYGREEGMTTGASEDLEMATRLAEYMICCCGMDEEIGLAVIDRNGAMCDGRMNEVICEKINTLLNIELEKAMDEIDDNRETMDRLVERLLQETHLDSTAMQAVFEKI